MRKTALILSVLLLLSHVVLAEESRKVTKAEFGQDWPLKSEEAEIRCLPGKVLVIKVDDQDYALNDLALKHYRQQDKEIPHVDEIAEQEPLDQRFPEIKVIKDTSVLVDAAVDLCPRKQAAQ